MKTENTIPETSAKSTLTDLQWLREKDACTEGKKAVEAAGGLVEFWRTTERSDWMLWLNWRLDILTRDERKTFAYKCANAALDAVEPLRPKLKDSRLTKVLDVARAFLADAASRAELVSALEAAADARSSLWSAYRSARSADAYAAAYAYAYAYAAAAAAYAAYAAAADAYDAYAADAYDAYAAAAADAARTARRRQQADWLREIVSPERFAEALEKAKNSSVKGGL